jgi:hypothetical protein
LFHFANVPSGVTDIVESIQKFRRYDPYSLSMLVENYLYAADLDKLNDPFEGMVRYSDGQTFEEICYGWDYRFQSGGHANVPDLYGEYCLDAQRFFAKHRQLHIEAYEQRVAQVKAEGYFSALTKFKDYSVIPEIYKKQALLYGVLKNENSKRRIIRRQHEEINMWSHYGDGLNGFRITYDPIKIFSIPNISARFIKYQDHPEEIDATKEVGDRFRDPSGPRRDQALRHELFGIKGTAWAYEREIRIRIEKPGKIPCPENSIIAITFGAKMPEDQRSIIRNLTLLHNHSAKFYEARRSDKEYKIEDLLLP